MQNRRASTSFEGWDADDEFTEFVVGFVVGAIVMAAIMYIRAFRILCLASLAAGVVYVLFVLGIDGGMSRASDLVSLAAAHPVFFLGLATGKFVQGLLAFRSAKRRPEA